MVSEGNDSYSYETLPHISPVAIGKVQSYDVLTPFRNLKRKYMSLSSFHRCIATESPLFGRSLGVLR